MNFLANRLLPFTSLLTMALACQKSEGDHPAAAASASAKASASAATVVPEMPKVDPGVSFGKKPFAAGLKRTMTVTTESDMSIKMGKNSMQMKETAKTEKDEEILEAEGLALKKVRVTYKDASKTTAEDGKAGKERKLPTHGKTYIVTMANGKRVVLTDKEKPAPKAEADLVAKEYDHFGEPEPIVTALTGHTYKPGDDVPELAKALATELADADEKKKEEVRVEGLKVTFKGKEGNIGTFTTQGTLHAGAGPFKMNIALSGTLRVRLDSGWPDAMKLAGPIALELNEKDKKAGVEGSGTMKLEGTSVYP